MAERKSGRHLLKIGRHQWRGVERTMAEKENKKKGGIFQAVKEFVYGVAAHDSARFALKSRASMEHLFILITMGDMLGVPILPPYYSLRLLPYVVPQISTWKRRMLREKDLTDGLA
jgi:hypothetical protein